MIRAALLLVVLGGCENILGLEELHADGGGSGACSPQSHDEDGDGVPDCRDMCPGIADDQKDTDGDGVGDACDPQPGKPDMLVKFYAFDSADDLFQFTKLGGNWRIQDDGLVNDDMTGNKEDHLLEGTTRGVPIAIEAEVTIDAIDPTPFAGGESQVAIEYRTGEMDEYSCEIIRRLNNTGSPEDLVQAYARGSTTEQPLTPLLLRAKTDYQIREVLTATSLRCEITGGDAAAASEQVEAPALESAGVYSEDVGVHYHYLAIYALGN